MGHNFHNVEFYFDNQTMPMEAIAGKCNSNHLLSRIGVKILETRLDLSFFIDFTEQDI